MEMYFSIGFGYLEQTLIPAVVVWLMAACVQRALLCRTHRAVSSAKFAGQLGAELLFIWYTVAILKITGIIGMAFRLDWARNAVRAFRLTVPFAGGSMLMITLNLLLFVPFGFLLPMAIRWERWNWRWALLAGPPALRWAAERDRRSHHQYIGDVDRLSALAGVPQDPPRR